MKYDFREIEPKWQKYWDEHESFKAETGSSKPKFYSLVEFPSGSPETVCMLRKTVRTHRKNMPDTPENRLFVRSS